MKKGGPHCFSSLRGHWGYLRHSLRKALRDGLVAGSQNHGRSVWWVMTYVFLFLVWFFSPFPVNRVLTWFVPGLFWVHSGFIPGSFLERKSLCHHPRQRSSVTKGGSHARARTVCARFRCAPERGPLCTPHGLAPAEVVLFALALNLIDSLTLDVFVSPMAAFL